MRRLWLWVALGLGLLRAPRARRRRHQVFEPVPYPSIRNQSFIKACLDAHNRHRAEVTPPASNMLYMTWDLALAKTARAWGKKCIYQHNKFRKLKGGSHPDPKFNPPGENIWIGNALRRPFDPTNPVRTWYSEVVYYNYQNNSCSQICGHYTQIVWDTSYKLGCAIVYCRKLGNHRNIEKLVCNYGPAGNYPRRPYKTGQPCSACPKGDTCENKLCRNPARDHDNSKRYSRWFPPWEHRIICDESCIAVAVLRPSLMFLAFAAVYCLQRFYPDLNLQK